MKMHFVNNTEVNPPRKLAFDKAAEVSIMQETLKDVYLFLNDINSSLVENDYIYLYSDKDNNEYLTIDDLAQMQDNIEFLCTNLTRLWGKA